MIMDPGGYGGAVGGCGQCRQRWCMGTMEVVSSKDGSGKQ